MRVTNSVCTTVFFPASRKNIDEFRRMAEFLADLGMQGIEFYFDGAHGDQIGGILQKNKLDGIFIPVLPSKELKLWLCAEDPTVRRMAVELVCNCMDFAQRNGITQLMINSGRHDADEQRGLDALGASIADIYDHAAKKGYTLNLMMEPSDRRCEAFHLIGPYKTALAFAKQMHERGYPLMLTMDSAHSAEDGEDFAEAVRAVKPYCRHVHFANCFLADDKNPLYGDKHLGFEHPETVWTPATLAKLYADLEAIYPGDEKLRLALEVLCRADDPYAYFAKTWEALPFLHRKA